MDEKFFLIIKLQLDIFIICIRKLFSADVIKKEEFMGSSPESNYTWTKSVALQLFISDEILFLCQEFLYLLDWF